MGERYQAIKAALERAAGFKKFRADKAAMENKPAKPLVEEKPVMVTEISEEEAAEAMQHAENDYKENENEAAKRAA